LDIALNKHLEDMIAILDTNATYQYQEDEVDMSRGTPKSVAGKRAFTISMDTILRGSALKQDDLSLGLDEQLKARFLTRLFREYRRNMEKEHRNANKSVQMNITERHVEIYDLPSSSQLSKEGLEMSQQSMRSIQHRALNNSRTMKEVNLFEIEEVSNKKANRKAPKKVTQNQSERVILLP